MILLQAIKNLSADFKLDLDGTIKLGLLKSGQSASSCRRGLQVESTPAPVRFSIFTSLDGPKLYDDVYL